MAKPRWILGGCGLVMLMGMLLALALQPLWLLTGLSPFICPNAIYAVDTDQPVIALTLDDGPDLNPVLTENTTVALLDLLAQYHAHATFFLISDKLTTPLGATLAQAIVDHGHELGNHFTTDRRSIRAPTAEFTQSVQAAEQTLAQFDSPQWFRPAGGFCSVSNVESLRSQGYDDDIVLGNIWPYDTHMTLVAIAIRQILQNAQPGGILILHDSDKAGFDPPPEGQTTRGQRAVRILAAVIPSLQAQGFQLVSLTTLATYGAPLRNGMALPEGVDRVRRRLVAGMLLPSLLTFPSRSAWGAIALISVIASGLMLWLGFRTHFLRWRWLAPPSSQSSGGVYGRIMAISFFLPALVGESIFRLILLPTPEEVMEGMTRGQWVECAVSLGLFVLAHPLINGFLGNAIAPAPPTPTVTTPNHTTAFHEVNRDIYEDYDHHRQRGTGAIAYGHACRQPTFISLTTILGGTCTLMYFQSGSIWPPVLFHWATVATWLLALGGYNQLHPIQQPRGQYHTQ